MKVLLQILFLLVLYRLSEAGTKCGSDFQDKQR